MSDKGHIELERQIDSITVGVRHRKDPGDMTALMKSIEEVGLLQPVTVTPDGVLVCGWRRLEAMRRLGRRTLSVWVRSGISDQLSHLLAQQDENEQRKPLSPVETARLYDEIKVLEKEDAAASTGSHAVRRRPAAMAERSVPGSHRHRAVDPVARAHRHRHRRSQRLEQINWIESVAKDDAWASRCASSHANMLTEIDNGAPVAPAYKRVKAAVELASKPPPPTNEEQDEVTRLAAEALKRVQEEENAKRLRALRNKAKRAPRHHSPRSFTLMWSELEGWTELYDVNELAARSRTTSGRASSGSSPRPSPCATDSATPVRRPRRPDRRTSRLSTTSTSESRCATSPGARSLSSSAVSSRSRPLLSASTDSCVVPGPPSRPRPLDRPGRSGRSRRRPLRWSRSKIAPSPTRPIRSPTPAPSQPRCSTGTPASASYRPTTPPRSWPTPTRPAKRRPA